MNPENYLWIVLLTWTVFWAVSNDGEKREVSAPAILLYLGFVNFLMTLGGFYK